MPGQPVQGERATFVVVAGQPRPPAHAHDRRTATRLRPFLAEKDTVELTDDHVPVDQLLAPVFGESLQHTAEEAIGE